MTLSKTQTMGVTIAVTALTALTLGCARTERAEDDPSRRTPAVTQAEIPGTSNPSDITPMTARVRVSDLKVGTLGAAGMVLDNSDEARAGATLHASIKVGDVAAGSRLKAVWLGPNEVRISDEVKTVAVGDVHMTFRAPDTKTWAAGDYQVEIYLGDELAAQENFEIVDSTS